VPAATVLLYWVPPGAGAPYPPCWFHALTGLHCPGCGGTRCAYALLHGDVAQAAAYNGLFVLCLPLLLLWAALAGVRAWRSQPPPTRWLHGWPAFAIVLLLLLFAVLRNLPFSPFNLLAPHQL
jgi:hypothetical protein